MCVFMNISGIRKKALTGVCNCDQHILIDMISNSPYHAFLCLGRDEDEEQTKLIAYAP